MDFYKYRFFRHARALLGFSHATLWVFVFLFILGTSVCLAETSTKTITDFLGRKVTLPTKIDRVISTYPPITTIVYMLAPEKLLGWNFKPDTRCMPPQYAALPVVGGWFGLWSGNYETMIAMKPDVIFYETMLDQPDGGSLAVINERQRKFGTIPVVGFSGAGDVSRVGDCILAVGDMLDVSDKARQLLSIRDHVMKMVSDAVADIPPENRVRVYYAERPDGLSTDPSGSRHSVLIPMCGGINVADCALKQGMGLSRVSMEQVLQWNPEVIITEQKSIYDTINKNPIWAGIEAVRKKRVYLTPLGPFCWFDRPPGASTFPGILWTAAILYPERFKDIDLRGLTRRFYAEFYHYTVTDAELDRLLGPSFYSR